MLDALWRAALRVAYRLLRIYWQVFRPHTEGVCVLVWHEDRLLVLRHSYKPGVGIPAGAPQRGEAPIATALRELREEVGVTLPAESLRLLGECHPRHEAKHDHLIAFETRLERAPAIEIDRREIVAAWWAGPSELADSALWPPLHELLYISAASARSLDR